MPPVPSVARLVAPAPGAELAAPDVVALGVLGALEVVAVALVVGIWRERGPSLPARLFWTVVTLVPVLGLLAYALVRSPPPPSDPIDRPPERLD